MNKLILVLVLSVMGLVATADDIWPGELNKSFDLDVVNIEGKNYPAKGTGVSMTATPMWVTDDNYIIYNFTISVYSKNEAGEHYNEKTAKYEDVVIVKMTEDHNTVYIIADTKNGAIVKLGLMQQGTALVINYWGDFK